MNHTWSASELLSAAPPARITISQWAVQKRELSRGSAVTGLYPLELTPFFGPIMDACGSTDIDQVSVCACAQIGKNTMYENVIGYYVDQDPSPVYVVLANQETSEYMATERFAAMFRDSAELSYLYDEKTFNNAKIKTKNGAVIYFGWASSVAKMGSKNIRITFGDEVDKPGWKLASGEASSKHLLKQRTASYPTGYYKNLWCSTPKKKEDNITVFGDSADIIYDWHAKCQYCGQKQPLRFSPKYCYGFHDNLYRAKDGTMNKFGRVVWDGGRDATKEQIKNARYECGECGAKWTTQEKNTAVCEGEMVGRTEPTDNDRHVHFHLNRLYSLMDAGNLATRVDEFVKVFRLPKELQADALQDIVNSTLAEPWQTVIKISTDSEEKVLKSRVSLPPQTIPEEAVALTAFVDVQKHGFWFSVRAFARDFSSWLIHYGFLGSWPDVEDLLFNTVYPTRGSDSGMRIWRAAVDTGGGEKFENMSMVEETYNWLRKNARGRGCRVWGTKGSSKPFPGPELSRTGKPLDKSPSGKPMPRGFRITLLDSHKLKNIFHSRLKSAIDGDPDRPAYLHSGVGVDYARQILAEELTLDDRGQEFWRQKRYDNHLLDCECGCIALAEPDWEGGGVNLIRGRATAKARRRNGAKIYSKGVGR